MNILFPIAGFFAGVGIRILQDTPAKKRNEYAIRAVFFFLGFIGGYLMVFFLEELVDHLLRRKAFQERQQNK
jgi:hypothetical protein